MNFGKFSIGRTDTLKKELNDYLAKAMTEMNLDYVTPRPDISIQTLTKESGAKQPIYPFPLPFLYKIAREYDSLRVPLEILRRELFRNGLEIVEAYKYKCLKCGKEFDSKPEDAVTGETKCDTCGFNKLVRPAPEHRKYLDRLITDAVNENGQSLLDVLYELEWDLDVSDNGCIILLKSYNIGKDSKKIINKTGTNFKNEDIKADYKDYYSEMKEGDGLQSKPTDIVEVMRVSPTQYNIIADKQGRIGFRDGLAMSVGALPGNAVNSPPQPAYVCPFHRNKLQTTEACTDCGTETLRAIIEVSNVYTGVFNGSNSDTSGALFYGEGEVIFGSKFMPSLLFGFSPVYSLYTKIMTLSYMDNYLMHYFDNMRPPRGLLFVSTRNFESLYKMWKTLLDKVKENPHEIHPIAVENEKGGKNMAQFIDLMRSLEEMQFVDARNEFRRIIMMMYGVSPIFGGEIKGGITNESLQITITNRAMEFGHMTLENRFLNKLTKTLGISDWIIRFRPAEAVDKLRELQIRAQEINNAEAMARMGYSHKLSHTGEFIFSKEPVNSMMGKEAQYENKEGLSGKRATAPKESQTKFDGEPLKKRPSDTGGSAEGSPASGTGTTYSNKADRVSIGRELAANIGHSIGVDWSRIDIDDFGRGLSEEMTEHLYMTPYDAGRLVMDHLLREPNYYRKTNKEEGGK